MPTNSTDDVIEMDDPLAVYQEFVDAGEFVPDEVVDEVVNALAAALRSARADTRRLDWLLDEDFAVYDGKAKEYRIFIRSREELDAAIAAEEE